MEPLTRRQALAGATLVGVGVPLIAACGGNSGSSGSSGTSSGTTSGSTPSGSPGAGAKAGQGIVAVGDVPVGGGVILTNPALVVTQPEAGTFKAFSSTCTHMGCTVNAVADGTIDCPCHGSRFSIDDGSVQSGPAPSPLPETAVKVVGGQVVEA
ncbi:Rieske (2Fe-2S) protein [Nocardioides guangzhouensis]|uniref:Rieske (2Fe-2S) protein n=1 Tax=Nocardioides guangzhouensis TaxID=2497878 RepID=UPI001C37795B|nr:Rieske (2Fe-2S) protein [Nocardioides guangzhouensis]